MTPIRSISSSIGLHDVDIAELLQKLKLKIAYKINGKVTAQLTLSVPVGNVMSSAAYEFTGTVSSPELKFRPRLHCGVSRPAPRTRTASSH